MRDEIISFYESFPRDVSDHPDAYLTVPEEKSMERGMYTSWTQTGKGENNFNVGYVLEIDDAAGKATLRHTGKNGRSFPLSFECIVPGIEKLRYVSFFTEEKDFVIWNVEITDTPKF